MTKDSAMIIRTLTPILASLIVCAGLYSPPSIAATAAAVDAVAALALAKRSNCLKCHAIDRKRDGPSYKEVSAKYKGKAGAEAALYKHLTSSPKVKVDGVEETHDSPKTKDEKEIRNLVAWILSQ